MFLNAFNDLKMFLYRGTCDLSPDNCHYLLALAVVFQVDSLKVLLTDYLCRTITVDNVDALVATVQLAHGIFIEF